MSMFLDLESGGVQDRALDDVGIRIQRGKDAVPLHSEHMPVSAASPSKKKGSERERERVYVPFRFPLKQAERGSPSHPLSYLAF